MYPSQMVTVSFILMHMLSLLPLVTGLSCLMPLSWLVSVSHSNLAASLSTATVLNLFFVEVSGETITGLLMSFFFFRVYLLMKELTDFFGLITLVDAASKQDIPLDPYLPEPRNLDNIKRLSPSLQRDWLAACKKELLFVIENETLDGGESNSKWEMKSFPACLYSRPRLPAGDFWTS